MIVVCCNLLTPRRGPAAGLLSGLLFVLLINAAVLPVRAADAVTLHVDTLTVPPSTQPLLFVVVRNTSDQPYDGTVTVTGPDGWRLAPAGRPVTLAAGETKRVPFTIEQGRNVDANTYPLEVTARGAGGTVVQRQETFVASAPYFQPTIDGQPDEWKDAIPVRFLTAGKQTVVSTAWSRRRWALLIAVQEDRLVRYAGPGATTPCDAVQLALAPLEPAPGAAAPNRAGRFEFLLVATGDSAQCFQLATPDTELAAVPPQALASRACADAEVAVGRRGDVTYYECVVPWRAMRDAFRPSEGAEFCFAVVVHDPDGVGRRALTAPAATAAPPWSRWPGDAPHDPALPLRWIRWGLCTSKY